MVSLKVLIGVNLVQLAQPFDRDTRSTVVVVTVPCAKTLLCRSYPPSGKESSHIQLFSAHLEHCRQKEKQQILLQINRTHMHCVKPVYPNIRYSEASVHVVTASLHVSSFA